MNRIYTIIISYLLFSASVFSAGIKINNNNLSKAYLGSNEASKIYLGTNLLWEKSYGALDLNPRIPEFPNHVLSHKGFVASSLNHHSASYTPGNAFTGVDVNAYVHSSKNGYDSPSSLWWLQIELPVAKRIWKTQIRPYDTWFNVRGWSIHGSNDGNNWTQFHHDTGTVPNELTTYNVDSQTTYKYYRLYWYSSGGWMILYNWQLFVYN